ncbi:DNAJ JJJ1 homolog [Olea europaea subsp. europaea]|uniref:DNAJ JJJ1 homolog n=2 Tax=Olea europaea subsp. europaea TaxID=158383 RepID=A0A8S0PT60_OLEEU|nr:DNAJ JJJ1 homolog [Olea europaea subsp. europaea]
MASSEKRCLYEVLGLSRDCTPDEIRSAYKKLALQRHPDKLVQSGVPEVEATAAFQELVNAYEVLSDPRERVWYDSHRSEILFSSNNSSKSSGPVPDLFSFFSNSVYSGYSDSGRGFYKVYGEIFEKIYAAEFNFAKKLGLPMPKEAPVIGNLESPYAQVTAFYNYWLGFATSMDFCWVDQYDVMAGPNRKSRRVMEEENKKLRKKAKREYNETVRGLAEFVRKRDKRVIDMQAKRNEEMERKREEERWRKKELERQKVEKARNFEEPEWTKVKELESEESEDAVEEDAKKKELYCVACGKKFKSDKQWKNHERSKKHKEKVAELREAFGEEDTEFEVTEGNERKNEEKEDEGYLSADDGVNDLRNEFEDSVGIHGLESNEENAESNEEGGIVDIDNGSVSRLFNAELESDDDEASLLEAMVSGHKTRKKVDARHQTKAPEKKIQVEVDVDETGYMEYNNTKGSRRNKGGKRRKGRTQEEETIRADVTEANGETTHIQEEETIRADVTEDNGEIEEQNGRYDDSHVESTSNPVKESANEDKGDNASERDHDLPKQAVNKRNATKKSDVSKSKVAPKGRKHKAAAKVSGNVCEKCGEEFESRYSLLMLSFSMPFSFLLYFPSIFLQQE